MMNFRPDKNAAGYETIHKSDIFNSDTTPHKYAANNMKMEHSGGSVFNDGINHPEKSWVGTDAAITIDSADTQYVIDDSADLSEIIAQTEGKFKSKK